MKKQAFILLLPLSVFLTETASFLPCADDACVTPTTTEKNTCSKIKKQTSCAAKKESSSCSSAEKKISSCQAEKVQPSCTAKTGENTCSKQSSPEPCKSKKACDKRSSGKGCTDDTDCTTCPVCYTFIFQSQYEWTARQFIVTKNYSLLNTNYTSVYTNSVWKPPNGNTVFI